MGHVTSSNDKNSTRHIKMSGEGVGIGAKGNDRFGKALCFVPDGLQPGLAFAGARVTILTDRRPFPVVIDEKILGYVPECYVKDFEDTGLSFGTVILEEDEKNPHLVKVCVL